ncbi:MAG: ABC transporter substrate-binding protein, partial [Chloroflexota bacterium]
MKRLSSVRLVALFALVALIATFAPVTAQDTAPAQNLTDACVENFDPDTDYFPDKIEIVDATGFEVEYFNHYKVVTVTRPWPEADEDAAVTYVLVQCGTPAPDDIEADAVINVPVNNFVSMSTTYLPYMDLFGVLDGLVGVDMASLASNEAVLDKAAAGELVDIAPNFNVDIETAIDLDPELIFTYGFGFETDSYLQLAGAGLPVALNGEFAEITPLARAEWGKFLSLFFNTEAIAEAEYSAILDEYAELSEMAAQVDDSPTVFLNSPFDGVWYMPGGVSYMATFLQDANVDYLWSDDGSTGVLFLDF